MRVQEPKPQQGTSWGNRKCLVELGGWYDHLAAAELRAMAGTRVEVIGHRLARVEWLVADLLRLGASRAVHVARGASASPERIPDDLGEALRGTFAVRFHDPGGLLTSVEKRKMIGLIWRAHSSPVVDLDRPDHEIHVFAAPDSLWFGERVGECAPELRTERQRRPFFRSYETPPRKARVLANLGGAGPGKRFIDPFCGTGALVIEAARVGAAAAAGSDIDPSAVIGAALNAGAAELSSRFVIADARTPWAMPASFQSAATDLPYGKSASRRGAEGSPLYVETLDAMATVISEQSRVAVMSLAADHPRSEPSGWHLQWTCREEARRLVRAISIWQKG